MNCTNCTMGRCIAGGPGPQGCGASLCYFAGGFASAHPVVAEQILDPTGWGEPARLVRSGEQPRDVARERGGLLGGEVPRQLVQQPHQLTNVGRASDTLSPGEPALELRTGDAAGDRAV